MPEGLLSQLTILDLTEGGPFPGFQVRLHAHEPVGAVCALVDGEVRPTFLPRALPWAG